MEIIEIHNNKKDFIEILLIGDEQESMIEKYINKGSLFVLYDKKELKSACLVSEEDKSTIEIKNLATYPSCQNQGYASALLDFVFEKYKYKSKYIILGTGTNNKILNFYKKRGFNETHRIKDFFLKNYDHPIIEEGKQLVDMIYLKKEL